MKPVNLTDFLSDKICLIIEPIRLVRSTLIKFLTDHGMPRNSVYDSVPLEEAEETLKKKMPQVIFFRFDGHYEEFKSILAKHIYSLPNRKHCLFALISEDNSPATKTEPLEHDELDLMLLLPMTYNSLKTTIERVVVHKLGEGPFYMHLEEGKEKFYQSSFGDANSNFNNAIKLNPKTSLPHYYQGNIHYRTGDINKAIECFEEGLSKKPNNYKCLRGLSRIYWESKNYQKAYETNLDLLENYPILPERLPELIRLSIINKQFEDLEKFTEFFLELKNKDKTVQKNIAASLGMCGRHYFSQGQIEKAENCFLNSAKLSQGNLKILEFLIDTLIEKDKIGFALELFEKYVPHKTSGTIPAILHLRLMYANEDYQKCLSNSRKLLQNKIVTPKIYEILICSAIKLNKQKEEVESLVYEAQKQLPENKDYFPTLLLKAEITHK